MTPAVCVRALETAASTNADLATAKQVHQSGTRTTDSHDSQLPMAHSCVVTLLPCVPTRFRIRGASGVGPTLADILHQSPWRDDALGHGLKRASAIGGHDPPSGLVVQPEQFVSEGKVDGVEGLIPTFKL
jgi:hypothetical protein